MMRCGLGGRGLARVVELVHGGANFGQAADVGFRADDGADELAALPGLAILEDLHPVRLGGGQGVQVADDVGVARDAVAQIVAQHFLGGGNGGIVAGPGPVFEFPLGRPERRAQQNEAEMSHTHSEYTKAAACPERFITKVNSLVQKSRVRARTIGTEKLL